MITDGSCFEDFFAFFLSNVFSAQLKQILKLTQQNVASIQSLSNSLNFRLTGYSGKSLHSTLHFVIWRDSQDKYTSLAVFWPKIKDLLLSGIYPSDKGSPLKSKNGSTKLVKADVLILESGSGFPFVQFCLLTKKPPN